MTSFKDAGSGSATPFGSSHLKSQGKLSPGTLRGKGRGADQETRGLEADTRRNGHTWGELQRLAQDRDEWRVLIGDLCPRRGYRQ